MNFKLPNFLHSGHLNGLRMEMGAPISEQFRPATTYRPIELPPIVKELRETGIDIDFDEIKILDDGTLSYKGYRVLVYIRDIANYGDQQSLPKYHLSYCRTLETMRANKRFQRYVVANRDDGSFQLNFIDQGVKSSVQRLDVCQNCLGKIAWKGFRSDSDRFLRKALVSGFDLKDFFLEYPRDLITVKPEHTSDTGPLNDYTDDWGDVSERTKRNRSYICEKCNVSLNLRETRYLHVHHKNGLKNDNSESNLEVLCFGCHAEEPLHSHMKNLPDHAEFIAKFGIRRQSA